MERGQPIPITTQVRDINSQAHWVVLSDSLDESCLRQDLAVSGLESVLQSHEKMSITYQEFRGNKTC